MVQRRTQRSVVFALAATIAAGCGSSASPSADARAIDRLLAVYAPGVVLDAPTRQVRRARATIYVERGSVVYLRDTLLVGLDGFRALRLRYPREESYREPAGGEPVFGAELDAKGDSSARLAYARIQRALGRPHTGRRCAVKSGVAQVEVVYWTAPDRVVTIAWWLPSHEISNSRGIVEIGFYIGGERTLAEGETAILGHDPPECPPGSASSSGV